MGCKKPLGRKVISIGVHLKVHVLSMQSVTVVHDLRHTVNLFLLSNSSPLIQYEPELFPAARLLAFRPLCVNVFASGKVVITGLRTLCFQKLVSRLRLYLLGYLH